MNSGEIKPAPEYGGRATTEIETNRYIPVIITIIIIAVVIVYYYY